MTDHGHRFLFSYQKKINKKKLFHLLPRLPQELNTCCVAWPDYARRDTFSDNPPWSSITNLSTC